MDDLMLRERHERGVSVLTVCGELDMWSGPQLDDYLIDLAALGRGRVVLDAAGLTFCDAAGIRILLRGHARARAREGWLRLAGADRRVRRVLAIVALTAVLPVFDSVADAIAGTPAGSGDRVAQPSGDRPSAVAAVEDEEPGPAAASAARLARAGRNRRSPRRLAGTFLGLSDLSEGLSRDFSPDGVEGH
jgi:anti-sigma B factor antagonist